MSAPRITCIEFCGFDWDGGNIAKCQKHGVTLADIELCFSRPVLLREDHAHMQDERRWIAVGTDARDRPVFVAFTKREQRVRVISARYMHEKERKAYEALKRKIQSQESE